MEINPGTREEGERVAPGAKEKKSTVCWEEEPAWEDQPEGVG